MGVFAKLLHHCLDHRHVYEPKSVIWTYSVCILTCLFGFGRNFQFKVRCSMTKIDAVISLKCKMYEKQEYTEYGVLSQSL
jgi:hypothetical protein